MLRSKEKDRGLPGATRGEAFDLVELRGAFAGVERTSLLLRYTRECFLKRGAGATDADMIFSRTALWQRTRARLGLNLPLRWVKLARQTLSAQGLGKVPDFWLGVIFESIIPEFDTTHRESHISLDELL